MDLAFGYAMYTLCNYEFMFWYDDLIITLSLVMYHALIGNEPTLTASQRQRLPHCTNSVADSCHSTASQGHPRWWHLKVEIVKRESQFAWLQLFKHNSHDNFHQKQAPLERAVQSDSNLDQQRRSSRAICEPDALTLDRV